MEVRVLVQKPGRRRVDRESIHLYRSESARGGLCRSAASIVVDEAASVFIYNTKWYGPFAKGVQSVRFCPVGNGQDFRWINLA